MTMQPHERPAAEGAHPVFGLLKPVPWNHGWWEARLTVCFTPADCGWCDLVLVSSAFGQSHIAYLSTIDTPFHDLLDWLGDVMADKLPARLLIDEEDMKTELTVLPYDDQWLEFRAGRPADPIEQPDGT